MTKLVSIITPTCNRTNILLRTVKAVKRQDYPRIEHVIIGDSHPTLASLTEQIFAINPAAIIVNLNTPTDIIYSAHRASIARNRGIDISRGEYIAHLDDDNEIEPHHISSLVACLEKNNVGAAHSWRKLLKENGNPFIVNSYPWEMNPRIKSYIYNRFVEAGIFVPETNEVRDQMITPWGDPILHVDTSEWLIHRDIHERIRFSVEYSLRAMIQAHTEDYVLAKAFHQLGVTVASSQMSTLLYYLGGYSNE